MNIIRTTADMVGALSVSEDGWPIELLQRRWADLSTYGLDLEALACFIVIQPGDSIATIESETGFPIATSFIDDIAHDEPGFIPSWEGIADHGDWYELVYVLSDDGFGQVIFVPDADGVDPVLLTLCKTYSGKPIG